MLICDTGPIIAALNRRDDDHELCVDVLQRSREQLAAPAPVVTETALFLLRSQTLHLRFVESVARGDFDVLDLEAADHARVAELCATYRDLPLDQVDASIVALAERYDQRAIASLDHRHFSIVRLATGRFLELLPERP